MLTLQDCIGFSGLTPDQLEAIADHEHLNMIVAAEWAECVLDRPNGCDIIEQVLQAEADYCRRQGDAARCRRYQSCLKDFILSHGGRQ